MLRILLITMLALGMPLSAHADAIGKLKHYMRSVRTSQANFIQEVLAANGKRLQVSSGNMQFARPGKFRWEYQKPYEQIMVGDGKHFWMYDVDLQQVTVKKLDAALGSSPAALLSGSDRIEKEFTLKDIPCIPYPTPMDTEPVSTVAPKPDETCDKEQAALSWLEATPRANDTNFSHIRMGFNARSELVTLELFDTFGHITILHFSGILRNPKFPPELFRFTPPDGVDVLGSE